ncbi:MAG: DEAD/DEAH box helicase [Planctomycetes bacterium]|nr:DEAD/DEAH box helicase [Planctomycetota bacterium]
MSVTSETGIGLALGPTGRLRVVAESDARSPAVSDALVARLRAAFDESNGSGFVALASLDWPPLLPTTLAYWRGWVRRFFRELCHAEGEPGEEWRRLPPLCDEELDAFVESAPPMVGLEFVTRDLLDAMWRAMRDHVADQAAADGNDPSAWLRKVNPLAHLVGRVTFHLAENKRDPRRPFAFLATFAHRLSPQSKPQHRPLADALRQAVTDNDVEKLNRLLEPVRRAAEQSPLVADLLTSKRLFAPQAWTAPEAYRFLKDSVAIESAGIVVRIPNWWAVRPPARPQVRVRVGARRPSAAGLDSLLDFNVDVVLDGEPLSSAEWDQLMAESSGLILLRGKWVEVDREKLREALDHWHRLGEEHPDGLDMIEGMRLLAGARIDADEERDAPFADWSTLVAGDWLRDTLARMRSPDQAADCEPGRDLRAELRPYQADGVRWLWFMTELGLGACLADDMGLGKTIQILDLLLQRKRSAGDARRPSLLIVPASLLGNWMREAARFTPTLRLFVAHRAETDAGELARRTADPAAGLADCDLVVTSYSMVRRQAWLERMHWSLIILDEGQFIKNAGSAQTKAVKKLIGDRRIVMTGTPIENHVGELWSLFDFASPGLLGTASAFKRYISRLNKDQESRAYAGLRRLVRPYILRRRKTDPAIARDLPDKIEMRTECGLTAPQTALYAQVVADLRERLREVDGIQRRGLVLSALMRFKQICNHPAQYANESNYEPARSGKFLRLGQLCEPIMARQEKVLVFTQFQSLCEPLAAYLATVFGQPGLVLHGATPVKKRSELVAEFQNGAARPFFVVSLKAGGSGLNLTAASHVVHFDRWWNPAVENQATDRAFRIGQTRNVLVHKFVCRGTIEERIDAMISDKRIVAEQILDAEGPFKLSEMTDDELLTFVALDLGRAASDDAS